MSSVYWRLLDSIRTQIAALEAFDGRPVVVRKRPAYFPDRGDTLPLVVISPGAESIEGEQFDQGIWYHYPVTVTLFQQQGATLASSSEMQYQLDRREEIRDLLYRAWALGTFPGVPELWDVARYSPQAAFDATALSKLADVSAQEFTFRTQEQRSV